MTELEGVIKYIDTKPKVLDVTELGDRARVALFVSHNTLANALDLANPTYRTITDLHREAAIAVREMRDEVHRLIVSNQYGELSLMDGVTVAIAIEDLKQLTIKTPQDCISYLTDLALVSYYTIKYNEDVGDDIGKEQKLVLDAIIYVSMVGLNLFRKVSGSPPEKEGVEINFARKRRRKQIGV